MSDERPNNFKPPWEPTLVARFHELLKLDPPLSYTIIAMRLTEEFGVPLTKNAVIGYGRRNGVPRRKTGRRKIHKPRTVKVRPRPRAKPSKPVVMKKPPKLRLPPIVKPQPRPAKLRIWQLEHHECRWPIDAVTPYFFCAKRRVPGSSYCHEHTHISNPSLARNAA